MARKPRADGSKFAVEAAAQLAQPLPAPPLPLSPRAEKYWGRVIRAKLASLWTDTDLDAAWGLAEDLAKIEQYRLLLQSQSSFYKDARGNVKTHPAVAQIELIERRIQATKRHLQINSAATNGPSIHLAGKNSMARQIAVDLIDDGSGLFA